MWDVVVVGGGPVGLLLAAEAAQAGASVLVLERGDGSLPEHDGDRGLQAATLEMFAARGLLEEVLVRAGAEDGPGIADFDGDPGDDAPEDLAALIRSWGSPHFKGHFAMLPLLDYDDALDDIARQQSVWQGRLVAVLADHARRCGVELRYNTEVVSVLTEDDRAGVRLADGDHISGRWVAGCDGARGVVAQAPGITFDDVDPAMVVLMGTPTLAEPLDPGVRRTRGGLIFVNPPPGQLVVVEFDRPARTWRGAVDPAEFEAALRRVTGTNVHVIGLDHSVRVTDHTRLADSYRYGRLLLAGDAAHLHSPMGGQGLNLGLQDAITFGPALASVVSEAASVNSLDQLTAQRRAVAARALRDIRAQTALLRTDPHSCDLRAVMADLIELPQVKRHLSMSAATGAAG